MTGVDGLPYAEDPWTSRELLKAWGISMVVFSPFILSGIILQCYLFVLLISLMISGSFFFAWILLLLEGGKNDQN